ncbi:hypothetical protein KGM_208108 [Danaus plexippus plexippus]|uniref:Uncharacterized protein n=1 Tax=Danaus plexippus plexippus TaxID=278856 RepID=A0A212FPT0_DANPL|nr:hypothetical protein KGM_208108 [Danaus plexippus plexippus]
MPSDSIEWKTRLMWMERYPCISTALRSIAVGCSIPGQANRQRSKSPFGPCMEKK